jgi:hypothetical protein
MDDSKEIYIDKPIFVLGLARSGTSMVAGALEICGAWLGQTVPGGSKENPKGFFENIMLREHVNKRILLGLGCDPLGVQGLPDLDRLPAIPNLSQAVKQIIRAEGYDGSRRWLFKDAKLSLLWPIYKAAFPNAQWIVVRRDTEEIIHSCLRTFFMVQHSRDPLFWKRWADEYLSRLQKLKESGIWWRDIWPHDLVRGNLGALRQIAQELELDWDEPRVRNFIEPVYWHG